GVIDDVVDDVEGRGVVAVLRAVFDAIDRHAEVTQLFEGHPLEFRTAQGVPTRRAHLVRCRQVGVVYVEERLGWMLHGEFQRDLAPAVGGVDANVLTAASDFAVVMIRKLDEHNSTRTLDVWYGSVVARQL